MADAPVLGAGSYECGFKSHPPHQKAPSQNSGLSQYFSYLFMDIV